MGAMLRVAACAAVLSASLLAAGPAAAHPLGNFSVNRYVGVHLSVSELNVDLVVDIAEIPTIGLLRGLDRDADGSLDSGETEAARAPLCAAQAGGLRVEVDGTPQELKLWAAGLHQQPGAAGLITLRLVCQLRAPAAWGSGSLELVVSDEGHTDRPGWREIVARADRLRVQPMEAGRDVSQRLTAYPADLLVQPLSRRALNVRLEPGGLALPYRPVPDAAPLSEASAASPPTPAAQPGTAPGGVGAELA